MPHADGSVGQCQKCHLRHEFSLEQVRKPETCNHCHIGPDHPQWEIYQESPHGISYLTGGDRWNWEAEPGTLTVNDFLRRAELVYPNRVAVVDEPDQPAESWGTLTYREMADRAAETLAGRDVTVVTASPLDRAQETAAPTAQLFDLPPQPPTIAVAASVARSTSSSSSHSRKVIRPTFSIAPAAKSGTATKSSFRYG